MPRPAGIGACAVILGWCRSSLRRLSAASRIEFERVSGGDQGRPETSSRRVDRDGLDWPGRSIPWNVSLWMSWNGSCAFQRMAKTGFVMFLPWPDSLPFHIKWHFRTVELQASERRTQTNCANRPSQELALGLPLLFLFCGLIRHAALRRRHSVRYTDERSADELQGDTDPLLGLPLFEARTGA